MLRFFNRLIARIKRIRGRGAVTLAAMVKSDAERRFEIVRDAHTRYACAINKVHHKYAERYPQGHRDDPPYLRQYVLPVVRYADILVQRHIDGDRVFFNSAVELALVFQYVPEGYSYSWIRKPAESELDYVRRCAVEDFNDGAYGSALCQDLYREVLRDRVYAYGKEFSSEFSPSVSTKESSVHHVLESDNSIRYRQATNR